MSNSWVTVGKIKDAHSLKGEVYVHVFADDLSWVEGSLKKPVTLKDAKNEDKPSVQYKILRAKPHKQGLIVLFEGFHDRNQAEAVKGFMFQIPQSSLVSKPGESIYLNEILDFKVFDRDKLVGLIKGFSSQPTQDIIVVESENKTLEIPLVKKFIQKIDYENKTLFMELPEGLLEL